MRVQDRSNARSVKESPGVQDTDQFLLTSNGFLLKSPRPPRRGCKDRSPFKCPCAAALPHARPHPNAPSRSGHGPHLHAATAQPSPPTRAAFFAVLFSACPTLPAGKILRRMTRHERALARARPLFGNGADYFRAPSTNAAPFSDFVRAGPDSVSLSPEMIRWTAVSRRGRTTSHGVYGMPVTRDETAMQIRRGETL